MSSPDNRGGGRGFGFSLCDLGSRASRVFDFGLGALASLDPGSLKIEANLVFYKLRLAVLEIVHSVNNRSAMLY